MNRKLFFIDGFILKIIAFVLMTLDHVGIFLCMMWNNPTAVQVGETFRLLGRFAFPLFVLMLVEGVRHTHCFGKYALRLGLVASAITIVQIVIYYCYDASIGNAYSPFLDLLCYGTFLYLLNRRDKWSILAIIPALLVFGSFAVFSVENSLQISVEWFPTYLRSGYSIFGFFIAVLMYYSYPLLKKFFESYHMDVEGYEEKTPFRLSLNISYGFAIMISVVIIYLFAKIPACDVFGVNNTAYSETWALVSILIILFYSGKRGFNAKWFQYASYLYFPLHLVIIYLIFNLL